jgi:hypothetical protein
MLVAPVVQETPGRQDLVALRLTVFVGLFPVGLVAPAVLVVAVARAVAVAVAEPAQVIPVMHPAAGEEALAV